MNFQILSKFKLSELSIDSRSICVSCLRLISPKYSLVRFCSEFESDEFIRTSGQVIMPLSFDEVRPERSISDLSYPSASVYDRKTVGIPD